MRTWKQGVQVLRVDWPVYPRRAEHNTVAEGGNRRWAEAARQNAVPIALAEADQRPPGAALGDVARTPSRAARPGLMFRARGRNELLRGY